MVKFNNFNNDFSFVKVIFFFLIKYCNFLWIFFIFLFGSLYFIVIELILILYIVMIVDGSIVFLGFIGIFIFEYKEINCDKFWI